MTLTFKTAPGTTVKVMNTGAHSIPPNGGQVILDDVTYNVLSSVRSYEEFVTLGISSWEIGAVEVMLEVVP